MITLHDIIKCIDALVCLYLKSQPCRAINSWSTRCSSHLSTTHPAAQPHIPRTTITSEDASRKLFNGDQLTTASLQTTTNLSTIVSYFQNANSIEVILKSCGICLISCLQCFGLLDMLLYIINKSAFNLQSWTLEHCSAVCPRWWRKGIWNAAPMSTTIAPKRANWLNTTSPKSRTETAGRHHI